MSDCLPKMPGTNVAIPGHASIAVEAAGLIIFSSMTGVNDNGEVVGDTDWQLSYILNAIKVGLEAYGLNLNYIVSVLVQMRDKGCYNSLERIWLQYFSTTPPARTIIIPTTMPHGAAFALQVTATNSPRRALRKPPARH